MLSKRVFISQIIRGAAIGDRAMVIENSVGLGFLTGYESKVSKCALERIVLNSFGQ